MDVRELFPIAILLAILFEYYRCIRVPLKCLHNTNYNTAIKKVAITKFLVIHLQTNIIKRMQFNLFILNRIIA